MASVPAVPASFVVFVDNDISYVYFGKTWDELIHDEFIPTAILVTIVYWTLLSSRDTFKTRFSCESYLSCFVWIGWMSIHLAPMQRYRDQWLHLFSFLGWRLKPLIIKFQFWDSVVQYIPARVKYYVCAFRGCAHACWAQSVVTPHFSCTYPRGIFRRRVYHARYWRVLQCVPRYLFLLFLDSPPI